MPRCTFHVGMHKTGSTSIQQHLFYDLVDPRFQYVGGGRVNGCFLLGALFQEPPILLNNLPTSSFLSSPRSAKRVRQDIQGKWDRAIDRALQRNAHLIFSAEGGFVAPRDALERVHEQLSSHGFQTDVFGYLRSWKPFHESQFQQAVKAGRKTLAIGLGQGRGTMRYQEQIENLWKVFGRPNVNFAKFDRTTFPQGCVVQDFQKRIGLPVTDSRHRYKNESLSQPAVQLLYAFNKYSSHEINPLKTYPSGFRNLLYWVSTLQGVPFHFHSRFLKPFYDEAKPHLDWVEQQLGIALHEPIDQHDHQPSILSEDCLLRFSRESLDWLAKTTGERTISGNEGESVAIEVARQMDKLRKKRLPFRHWVGTNRDKLRRLWIHATRYC